MIVRLYTDAGGFVVQAEIPPFNEYPHVLFWGSRVFYRNDLGSAEDGHYKEAFVYAIIPDQERAI